MLVYRWQPIYQPGSANGSGRCTWREPVDSTINRAHHHGAVARHRPDQQVEPPRRTGVPAPTQDQATIPIRDDETANRRKKSIDRVGTCSGRDRPHYSGITSVTA
jgi:hypothetical protein